jgi:hypothetical protein
VNTVKTATIATKRPVLLRLKGMNFSFMDPMAMGSMIGVMYHNISLVAVVVSSLRSFATRFKQKDNWTALVTKFGNLVDSNEPGLQTDRRTSSGSQVSYGDGGIPPKCA